VASPPPGQVRWPAASTAITVTAMKIGIGLPNPVPGAPGSLLPTWARHAELLGFSTLATIDRVAFGNHDSLIALAAAAAVTERIELLTNILLLPTRQPVLLAKEAATIASISEGRFTLGVGVGGREDDFVSTETSFPGRGKRMDEMLELMTTAWRGKPVGGSPEPVVPALPTGTVPLLIGGTGDAAIRRTVRYGTGWTGGGGTPEQLAPVISRVREAWTRSGREGAPRILALAYFSLGEEVEASSYQYLRHYYGIFGEFADMIAAAALRSPGAIRGAMSAFEDVGVDELILDPTVADLSQVDRLADVVF
jgi:alkanesulfonate monooxygenase SsuD/methylene tetrahydromethanopterin reductase-like flavin-dependent oxidoreductase (luciferase family)